MDRHDVNGTWQTGLVKQEAVHFLLSGRLGSLASPTGCCDLWEPPLNPRAAKFPCSFEQGVCLLRDTGGGSTMKGPHEWAEDQVAWVSGDTWMVSWVSTAEHVHGILQARILAWIAMPSSRRSSWPSAGQLTRCLLWTPIHSSCPSLMGILDQPFRNSEVEREKFSANCVEISIY